MAILCDAVLGELVNKAPEQADAIDRQIEQIEETQEQLLIDSTAIEECVCDDAADELRAYLEGPKLLEIQALWPENLPVIPNLPPYFGPVYLVIGPTYGSIGYGTGNITDWIFFQDPLPIGAPIIRYQYVALSDPLIDQWVDDFAFGNDYITHPLTVGASYGLNPLFDAYESAKETVLGNKAKIEASIDVFNRAMGIT